MCAVAGVEGPASDGWAIVKNGLVSQKGFQEPL